jgi:hypothetical protein
VILFSIGYKVIASILRRSILTPSVKTINSRKLTFFTKNSYFLRLIYRPNSFSYVNTLRTCSIYSSIVLKYIRISLR